MKAIHKKIFSALLLTVLFGFALVPMQVGAGNASTSDFSKAADDLQVQSADTFTKFNVGDVTTDPRTVIKRVINVVMGFLGMIAVLLILFGGFKWMTAGGNEENVKSAQKLLFNGIIGLIIIFSAWTLAFFAVNTIKVNVAS